jgi:glucosamine-6-phosphate deaminase
MSVSDITPQYVNTYPTHNEMGKAAGKKVEKKIIELLKDSSEIRMVFAAAPSQNEMLAYLVKSKNINWNRIVAFHMDEYAGLSPESPNSFANFLRKKLFDKVPFRKVNLINGSNPIEKEIDRYAKLLNEAPIDIVCLGIGENGHIAFNDPPVANFNDPMTVKKVTLDSLCRQQQVNDGCFAAIENVPQQAITLTIPTLMRGKYLFCVVPGSSKHEAVKKTLFGPISTSCPASILRTHPWCEFFFDTDSYHS